MCTIGALAYEDETGRLRVFGFKNADNPPVGYWHGTAGGGDGGFRSLAFGLLAQTGINAGLNERGLLVVSSYFGCEDPSESEGPAEPGGGFRSGDIRGRVQAEALARCETAADALVLLQERFEEAEERSIGGSHILADKDGGLYAFEHHRGHTAWQDASLAGWAARSNQAFGLFAAAQARQRDEIVRDRTIRLRTAELRLDALARRRPPGEEAIAELRSLLASHAPDGGGAVGSICAHGAVHGRSNAPLPHDTVSSMIWDVTEGKMHYTLGQPCRSEWRTATLSGKGIYDAVFL
ncbi:hypothetical protein H7B90_02825 [Cohnella xylanilytica]|uniref:Acyl-CoA:6-aminopenicillanic acid acyl transferase n=1 Tax=Cohnella xylanilytica TaxID=557555 RepID=A0A841TQ94_9BACL|nr:hypothetical protein [Cohnella xylanilytica]MBB6690325.1 hypothetical protein [Cohnella xylanilytica]